MESQLTLGGKKNYIMPKCIEINDATFEAMMTLCWYCLKPIPKDKISMYNYWCSDGCKQKDDEKWQKIINEVYSKDMDETTR